MLCCAKHASHCAMEANLSIYICIYILFINFGLRGYHDVIASSSQL